MKMRPLIQEEEEVIESAGSSSKRTDYHYDEDYEMNIEQEHPKDEKFQHLLYLIKLLLPFLTQIRKEQEDEIAMEERISTLEYDGSERLYCNRCSTSIFDLHRHCSLCKSDICLTCCQEVRKSKKTIRSSSPDCPDLTANNNGHVFCLGKGRQKHESLLNLWHILSETRISDLEGRAKHILNSYSFTENKHDMSKTSGDYNFRASDRQTSDDNYLYCSSKDALTEDDFIRFRYHLTRGEPIVIKDVLDQSCGISWEPMAMFGALSNGSSDMSKLSVIDCITGNEVEIDFEEFINCYTGGKKYPTLTQKSPQMLKLKDLSPNDSFEKVLPHYFDEFIRILPFREYTDPKAGFLNLFVKLPPSHLNPDLGPKAYIASGMVQELAGGNSVTNLHCDMSDAVNILTHTTEVTVGDEQRFKRDDGDSEYSRYRGDIGETFGALWEIFRREDVDKINSYLREHSKEFAVRYVDVCNPIHDQTFYLMSNHKNKLKQVYDVEPWTFEQCLGEAVFIPAGCPHQVRNLKSCTKLAVDFVSPENIKECMRLKKEIRELPVSNKVREDKLEINKMVFYAMAQSLIDIEALIS